MDSAAVEESLYVIFCERIRSEIREFENDGEDLKREIAGIEAVMEAKSTAKLQINDTSLQLASLADAVSSFGVGRTPDGSKTNGSTKEAIS